MNIEEILTRGVAEVLPTKEGLKSLLSEKKIKLYQGFDPSMPSLHLGNMVGLMKLRQFQKLGHKVIFLIGDFTGMIGDPTDKLATRKKLTRDEVINNFKAWEKQSSSILDFVGENKAEIKFNYDWLNKLSPVDILDICSNVTYQQLIERDMFQNRISQNKPIYMHEMLYPIFQGYDSVAMDVDLEIGGSDQLFNMLVGRVLLKSLKDKEKIVLTTKLLVDDNGSKVGKTTGNALFLDTPANEFYSGIMSFPDEVIYLAFELLTEVELEGLETKIKVNPMAEKKHLAYEITKIVHGQDAADKAQKSFQETFQNQKPETFEEVTGKVTLVDTIADKAGSKSEAKRLILGSAVDINGEVVNNPNQKVSTGDKIKVGKKIFLQVN